MGFFSRSPEAGAPSADYMFDQAERHQRIADNLGEAIGKLGSERMKLEDQGLSKSEIHQNLSDYQKEFNDAMSEAESWEKDWEIKA